MIAPRIVCILARPRTGSNRLLGFYARRPDLQTRDELFHGKARSERHDDEVPALEAAAGTIFADLPARQQWKAAHPGLTLDTLLRHGGDRPLVIKLFPGHLRPASMRAELFARTDVGYITLRRRPIESYISNVKASIVASYSLTATTDVKPPLDPADFVKWARISMAWDTLIEQAALQPRPVVRLTYEHDLSNPSDTATAERAMRSLQQLGIADHPMAKAARPHHVLQDSEPRFRYRVSNWAAFAAALRADRSDSALLKWALATPPLTQPDLHPPG